MSHEQQIQHSAAVKIQKVFRGYTVRKSVKKIVSIRTEVCEVERRLEDTELDSVRGVDCGVKELRKVVTRRVIAVQEKVDSIA
ncbi:BAG family molecular chaperone regulator 5, mitochondrial-like [Bidens hawaiensis]|uniref:BAG family molecular chaperone regulator 5, mitochondrial-like n=1 Tax=Bidens hawaiensis TaxID=980011 RepID=UPI00404B38D3